MKTRKLNLDKECLPIEHFPNFKKYSINYFYFLDYKNDHQCGVKIEKISKKDFNILKKQDPIIFEYPFFESDEKKDNFIPRTYVFIDAQNLHLSISKKGWEIDYLRFYRYLSDKYKIKKAFCFIGHRPEFKSTYKYLRKCGFELVFKKVRKGQKWIKGNVDSDLIVKMWAEEKNYDQAIVISGDGDFLPLHQFLKTKNKLFKIGIPLEKTCPKIFKDFRKYLFFIDALKPKIKKPHKKKVPRKTENFRGECR